MKYRVIQWATGSMGKTCLRAVIDHPDLELVGVYVYSDYKNGLDAGEIASRESTGVAATKDMEKILGLDADLVIHAPRIQFPFSYHNNDICRLLASGKNLITINGHSFPVYHGNEYAAEFERACMEGQSTMFSTGLNPGFIADKIAAAATGLCVKLDSVSIKETFDCISVPDKDYVFEFLGMGSDPEAFDLTEEGPVAGLINGMFTEVVALLAHRLNLSLETVSSDHGIIVAPQDISARAGVIRAGTVAATKWCWHGIVEGSPILTLSVNWIMGKGLPGFEKFDHWEIAIKGVPGIEITMNLKEPENIAAKTKSEQYAVAGSVINSIPEVCAAKPGIFFSPLFAPFRESFENQAN